MGCVLVVEDNAAIRETIQLAIESLGYPKYGATNGKPRLRCIVMCLTLLCLGAVPAAWGDEPRSNQPAEAEELGGLDIEQLANIKVSLAARVPVSISRTPAAVSVISEEDIRRDGARSIPEALRLAPGVDVAQIDSGRYAIGIRGFNDEFSDKLLVLEDRRPVYTPLLGGVLWGGMMFFFKT